MEALGPWIEGFLRDCRVSDLSPFTIEYYRAQLAAFETFARARNVIQVHDQGEAEGAAVVNQVKVAATNSP